MSSSNSPFQCVHLAASLSFDRDANGSENLRLKISRLEEKIEFMRVANQVLWEIVSEKCGVTVDEFKARVMEVDVRDGALDGRVTMRILDCPNCHQKVNSKRALCLYCEAPLPLEESTVF